MTEPLLAAAGMVRKSCASKRPHNCHLPSIVGFPGEGPSKASKHTDVGSGKGRGGSLCDWLCGFFTAGRWGISEEPEEGQKGPRAGK